MIYITSLPRLLSAWARESIVQLTRSTKIRISVFIDKLLGWKMLIIPKGLISKLITGTSRVCKWRKSANFWQLIIRFLFVTNYLPLISSTSLSLMLANLWLFPWKFSFKKCKFLLKVYSPFDNYIYTRQCNILIKSNINTIQLIFRQHWEKLFLEKTINCPSYSKIFGKTLEEAFRYII